MISIHDDFVLESLLMNRNIIITMIFLILRKSEMSQHKVKRRKLSNGSSTSYNESHEVDGVTIKQENDKDEVADDDREKYGDDDDILESSIPCIR